MAIRLVISTQEIWQQKIIFSQWRVQILWQR